MSTFVFVKVAVGVVPPGYFKVPDGDVKVKLVGVDAYTTSTVRLFPAAGEGNVIAFAPTIVVIVWKVPFVNDNVIALPVTVAVKLVSV
jgi:hypothetical protein